MGVMQEVPFVSLDRELHQKTLLCWGRVLHWLWRSAFHLRRGTFLKALEQRQILNGYPPWGGLSAGSHCRQKPNRRRHTGPNAGREFRRRGTPSDHLLDLGFLQVGCSLDQLVNVLGGEMGGQNGHPGHMEPGLRNGVIEHRKFPRCAGRGDALAGHVLGHVKLLGAVGEHGRVARRHVELSGVKLGDVGEEHCRACSVSSD